MDGRRFRRWVFCGGVLAASVGCHQTGHQGNSALPKLGQATAGVAGNPSAAGKSFWGNAAPATPTTAAVTPVEAKPKKTGPMPDFEAAAGDTLVEQALATPAPPNRDELLDMARLRYQRALKADANHKGAMLGLARMHTQLGEQERAEEAYQKYLKLYPQDGDVMHEVAHAHARWRDWAGAVSWCEAALRADPDNRSYRKTLGFCLARAGEWQKAFAALCRIMPEAQARHNLAGLLDHLGQPDGCRQQLQLALQADPNYAPAREFLAELDQGARPAEPGVPAQAPNPVQQAGGYAPRP